MTWNASNSMKSDGGSGSHLWHMATELRCHSAPPPPIERYDEFIAAIKSADRRGKAGMDGRKLRRAVVMRRNGQTATDIGRAIGVSGRNVWFWLKKLPPELAA